MEQIEKLVERFRQSPLIKESRYDDISAFNFTRKAFNKAEWNDLTTRARGMFINTRKNKIVCRGYDKFFQIDERADTQRRRLKKTLKFPVTAYLKENGFLGLISYNEETGGLRFATKARLDGVYVDMLKESFYFHCAYPERVLSSLKETDATLLVEVIEPRHDPHIIYYKECSIVLLDMVCNKPEFEKISYTSLVQAATWFGIPFKDCQAIYDTWAELEADITAWEDASFRLHGEPVEGFVLEDADGFMFKVKTGYYKLWKWRRTMIGKVANGKYEKGTDPFGDWLYGVHQLHPLLGTESIITLRWMYEN